MADIQVFDKAGKGRRLCPALSGWITARTCGQHRLKKIRCPSDCKYLDQHERFRHAKAAEGFHLAWARTVTPIYQRQDRDALDWLLACEFALYRQLRENTSTPDEAVVEGLKFVQRKLSPVEVVEAVGSSLGRALLQAVQPHLKQPRFDREKAQAVVQMLIDLFESHQGDEPRRAVNGFMGHLEENFDLSEVMKDASPPEEKPDADKPKIIVPR